MKDERLKMKDEEKTLATDFADEVGSGKEKDVRIEETFDNLAGYCGYFNPNTCVNNGYGCNHKDCEEGEIVRKVKNPKLFEKEDYLPGKIEWKLWRAYLRETFGSWRAIQELVGSDVIKDLYFRFKQQMFDNDFLKRFGCVYQGKCYSFSCPIATETETDSEIMLVDKNYEYDAAKDISNSGANNE